MVTSAKATTATCTTKPLPAMMSLVLRRQRLQSLIFQTLCHRLFQLPFLLFPLVLHLLLFLHLLFLLFLLIFHSLLHRLLFRQHFHSTVIVRITNPSKLHCHHPREPLLLSYQTHQPSHSTKTP